MKKVDEIIPLGFDCTLARMLKYYGLRKNSYILDYTVSRDFNLIVKNIINNLDNYNDVEKVNNYYINKYNVEFLHHSHLSIDSFKTLFNKRIDRFNNTVKNDLNCLFLRISHDKNNCFATNKEFSEIEEVIKLCDYIKQYKKNFILVLFLSCSHCYSNNIDITHDNLIIINRDDKRFNKKDSFGHNNSDIEEFIKKLK